MTATHYGYALAGAALLLFSVSVMLTRAATQRVELATGVLVALFVNVLVGGVVFAADLLFRANAFAQHHPAFRGVERRSHLDAVAVRDAELCRRALAHDVVRGGVLVAKRATVA